MNETNGIPKHVDDFTSCASCKGTGYAPTPFPLDPFRRECGMCAGSGRDYGVKIVVESVTFAPAPKPRDLTSAETALLYALK